MNCKETQFIRLELLRFGMKTKLKQLFENNIHLQLEAVIAKFEHSVHDLVVLLKSMLLDSF
jgi:hypothetical protein